MSVEPLYLGVTGFVFPTPDTTTPSTPPAGDSRVLDLVDALVGSVAAAWAPAAPDAVSRQYLAAVTASDLNDQAGRKVFFFPGPYTAEAAERGGTLWGYRVGAIVTRRYTGADKPTSAALKAWLDGEVSFVQQYLTDGLDYGQFDRFLEFGGRQVWTEDVEVSVLYDPDELDQRKGFRAEVAFLFREID